MDKKEGVDEHELHTRSVAVDLERNQRALGDVERLALKQHKINVECMNAKFNKT